MSTYPIRIIWVILFISPWGISGCTFGPKVIEQTHGDYAAALQRVDEEQVLSNIVRLRYVEAPRNLDVAAIAAQHELSASAEARPFFSTEATGNLFRSFQTLLPFDRPRRILESVKKTGRLVVLDEDVPGGASGFILREVLEEEGAFAWLDAPPVTITARAHRPAYGSDGDYFSKPNREDVFRAVYALAHEAEPARFPLFW